MAGMTGLEKIIARACGLQNVGDRNYNHPSPDIVPAEALANDRFLKTSFHICRPAFSLMQTVTSKIRTTAPGRLPLPAS